MSYRNPSLDRMSVSSVWTADDEFDPNTWSPPGESTWRRDRTQAGWGSSWTDTHTGASLTHRGENGRGTGQLAIAA